MSIHSRKDCGSSTAYDAHVPRVRVVHMITETDENHNEKQDGSHILLPFHVST